MRVTLKASPLAPGTSPVSLHIRIAGAGTPLVVLHGGWGYEIYPFARQIAALEATHQIVIPDRTGYGRSGTLDVQAVDFHQRAAEETLALLDALGVERPFLWGHSDGAVIALRIAIMAPERPRGIIAEATHFWRRKPASRRFFETMRDAPEQFGDRVVTVLERDHGPRWRALIATNGTAWLRIADEASGPFADLYDGRLDRVHTPVLLIHGGKDPRTEPGELEALASALRGTLSAVEVLPNAGHSPHSETASADTVTELAGQFLARTVRPAASTFR